MKNRARHLASSPRWLLFPALLACSQLLAVPEAVPQQSRRNGVILHEYINPSPGLSSSSDGAGTATNAAGASAPNAPPARTAAASAPPHIPGQPPALSLEISDDEPIVTGDGPLFDTPQNQPNGPLDPRAAANQLDDLTDHVDPLQYFPQFEPSIIPYKRQVVQNHATRTPDGSYLIELRSHTYIPVELPDGSPLQKLPTEDAFWGSFIIRAEAGKYHPIPSVAPSQRVLRIESEPAVPISIVRDQADNFYVQTTYTGLIRLNIQLAAPRFYFDGELIQSVRWNDFPAALRPTLAPEIQAAARRVLTQLAISRQQTPHEALMRLIEHFRDFESRALPSSARTGDIFETIALGKIGVCRHRSHAFVITAHALGIPTRYIYNETHAFVEIYWPAQGWRRIDLGGAADNVDVRDHNRNRPLHDGTHVDPLPQPPAYLSELDRILGNNAASDQTSDASQTSPTQEETEHADTSTTSTPPLHTPPATDATQAPTLEITIDDEPAPSTQAQSAQRQETRQPTSLIITAASHQVLRGQTISLQGRLTAANGQPVPNQPVKILLGPTGATTPESTTLLGTTQTNTTGHFNGQFPIAPNLAIGRWTLTATFEGTPELQPASSN